MGSETELIQRLRAGEEAAFNDLLDRFQTRLVRFAMTFVANRQAAEDVVQDTWIAALRGLDRFEERSSLSTWLFTICANRARTRGGRDARMVPIGGNEPSVDPGRFDGAGSWSSPPDPWEEVDNRLDAASLVPLARAAIEELPDLQRQVVTLRDVEGLNSRDVCEVLSITEANQRVLLHRGRARIRAAIERGRSAGEASRP